MFLMFIFIIVYDLKIMKNEMKNNLIDRLK